MHTGTNVVQNWLDSALWIATTVVLLVSANFGLSLFFSINHNILDPEVHLWPVAIKDGAWLALIGVLSLMRLNFRPLRREWPRASTAIWLAAAGCLMATAIALLLRDGTNLDVNYVRSLKNYFLYQLLPYLFIFLAPPHWNVRKMLFWSMVSALIISCSVYGLEASYKPGAAADPRMYGSMGNPNAIGLVASMVMLFLLSSWKETSTAARLLITTIICIATLLSASISAILILGALLLWKMIEVAIADGLKPAMLLVAQISGVFMAALVAVYLVLGMYTPFLMRLVSMIELVQVSSLAEMDSVSVRVQAWQDMGSGELTDASVAGGQYIQYDSAIQTFTANYSLAGVVMICLPMLLIGWCLLSKERRSMVFARRLEPQFFGCVVIFLLSGLLQYQLSHFPTNLLFNLTVALLVKEVVVATARQSYKSEMGLTTNAPRSAK